MKLTNKLFLFFFVINYCFLIACSGKEGNGKLYQKSIEKSKEQLKKSPLQKAIENEDTITLAQFTNEVNKKHVFKEWNYDRKLRQKELRVLDEFPLNWAIRKEKKKSIIKLIELGANPNVEGYNGCTPLFLYSHTTPIDYSILELLVKDKSNIDKMSDWKMNALGLAVFQKKYKLAETLLNKGANPNVVVYYDDDRVPLLMLALEQDDIRMFKLLLKYGANINLKSKEGYNIMDWASYGFYSKYISFLKKWGAKTSVELEKEKK